MQPRLCRLSFDALWHSMHDFNCWNKFSNIRTYILSYCDAGDFPGEGVDDAESGFDIFSHDIAGVK